MSRLVRNIGYNVIGQLTLLALGFVSARYIFSHLGSDVLGIIYFAFLVNTVVIAVLELGVTTTTIKEVSANHLVDPAYVRRIVRAGALVYWAGYALAASAVVVAAPWLVENWIELETVSSETAIDLLRILGAAALLSLPQAFYVSVLRGLQRMGIPNSIDVMTSVCQQVGIIVLISMECDVHVIAWWIAGVYALRITIYLLVTAKLFDWGAVLPKLDLEVIQRNRSFAGRMVAVSALAMIHMQADKLLISTLLPVSSIGVYGLLYSTVARGSILTASVAQGAFPALAELANRGDREQLLRYYQRLHDLLCYGLVPLFALLAFATFPLFQNVLDAETAADLVVPSALLGLGYYLNGTLTIPYYVCLAMNRADIAARQNFVALFTTLPVTLVLTWRFGFAGAAGSWVWYQLFAYAFSMRRVCRECLHIAPRQWFGQILRVLAIIAGTYGVAATLIAVAAPRSTIGLFTAYLGATLVFAICSWWSLTPDSRAAAAGLLKRSRPR